MVTLIFYSSFSSLLSVYAVVAARKTCHCSQSQQNCQLDGKCQSPLREDDFSCLVTRRYNHLRDEYIILQQCIHDNIDYGLYCNTPAVGGLVFDVSVQLISVGTLEPDCCAAV